MNESGTPPPGLPGPVAFIVKTIDSISLWSGRIFAWLVLPLMGALVYEVVARYFFDAPTRWAFDVTYMLYGTHFMLVAAFTLYMKGHIRTDFIYRLLSERWQGLVDAVLYLVFYLPAFGVFLWVSWGYAAESWFMGERSALSPWMPPIYPLKAVIPLAAGLLFLQGISEFLKSFYAALRGRWP